jgi:predicted RNase H-like HicB family nuclease
MKRIRYIPIEKNFCENRYVFPVELARTSNGDWLAWIETLPGCAARGFSKDEVLHVVKELARAYVRMLARYGLSGRTWGESSTTPMVNFVL